MDHETSWDKQHEEEDAVECLGPRPWRTCKYGELMLSSSDGHGGRERRCGLVAVGNSQLSSHAAFIYRLCTITHACFTGTQSPHTYITSIRSNNPENTRWSFHIDTWPRPLRTASSRALTYRNFKMIHQAFFKLNVNLDLEGRSSRSIGLGVTAYHYAALQP